LKEPEDLGLKVGTKKEASWTEIKDKCKQRVFDNEINIIVDEAVIALAEKKIQEEKGKV